MSETTEATTGAGASSGEGAGAVAPPAPPPRPPWLRIVRILAWVLLAIVLLAIPLYLEASWLRAGEYAMIGAVGAIGLTLLTGQAGQLSLAHAFFLLAGGVTYCVLAGAPGGEEGGEALVGLGLPPLLALLGAILVAAALGIAFAPVSARLSGIYLGVASFALVFFGFYLGQALPTSVTGGTASGRPAPDFSVLGFSFSSNEPAGIELFGVPLRDDERLWYLFLALTVIAYLLAKGAVGSRPGRAWRAVRDNETAASVLGVPVGRTKAGAFAISSGYAGLAGAMTVLWFDLFKPDENEFGTYGITTTIAFLAMVIIGGLGSVPGAVFGALLVYGFPKVLELLLGGSGPLLGEGANAVTPVILTAFVYGAAIILVVLFEPGGLAAIGRRLTAMVSSTIRKGR